MKECVIQLMMQVVKKPYVVSKQDLSNNKREQLNMIWQHSSQVEVQR